MTASSTTVGFTAANGEIIGPNGQPFIAKGINLYASQIGSASQVLQSFPGINMVRLAVQDLSATTPAALAAFIDQMTSAGVVVEIEDHSAPSADNNMLTSSALTNELSWYSSMASAYANNPYVWFGTMNEPDDTSNEAAVSAQEQQIYNAIRGAGDNNPIMLEQIGGFTDTGLVASDYASMTNVIWDSHFYGWVPNYSTDQATVNAALAAQIANAQSITTAEGVVPVIIGEYGVSTTGSGAADANATQVLNAVQSSGQGSLAWAWSAGTDELYNGSSLTTFGQEVANYIATNTAVPPSANDTTIAAGSNATITDAAGNRWTITSAGQVAVNGVADTTTANVTAVAYVNGVIWQENNIELWWSETSPGAGWNPPGGTAVSPLDDIALASSQAKATENVSYATITASAGSHMVFIGGSGDNVMLTGGKETVQAAQGGNSITTGGSNDTITIGGSGNLVNAGAGSNAITDNGNSNILVLPAVGKDIIVGPVLTNGDVLDLRTALASTSWNGTENTLSNYLSVTNSGGSASIVLHPTGGKTGSVIATLSYSGAQTLAALLQHSIT